MSDDLLGTADIAALLGLTRQRVHQLTITEGFPTPVAVLARRTVYRRDDVEAWALRVNRPLRDTPNSTR